jgi:hypothetical protein
VRLKNRWAQEGPAKAGKKAIVECAKHRRIGRIFAEAQAENDGIPR